jgi:hypothetical protein
MEGADFPQPSEVSPTSGRFSPTRKVKGPKSGEDSAEWTPTLGRQRSRNGFATADSRSWSHCKLGWGMAKGVRAMGAAAQ